MQPSLKKIDNSGREIFQVNKVDENIFYPLWHFHPQCEIMVIEESSGTLYIGDGIDHFNPGDVIMFGANIPHILRNYPEYFKPDSKLHVKATVIYFNENFLGDDFLNFEETLPIKKLLITARNGIIFSSKTRDEIKEQINLAITKKGFDRMMSFVSLMNHIATKTEYKGLSSAGFRLTFDEKQVNRLNEISDFLLKNFTRTIRLSEVSAIAHMSETAFCRYFKEKTNKTLITFLNEIRIGYACKLLIEKQYLNVSQICDRTGFNNLTNFNIQFKKIKNCSPLEYRSQYYMNKPNLS
ncbi:MAG: AraC family transcriptional regulator [Salinivirgaceae bacterium]|jgi:AraC-like DNA-binding protein|nr:AraC family transcriptional regulator [Salinivirgaceae bacterium]